MLLLFSLGLCICPKSSRGMENDWQVFALHSVQSLSLLFRHVLKYFVHTLKPEGRFSDRGWCFLLFVSVCMRCLLHEHDHAWAGCQAAACWTLFQLTPLNFWLPFLHPFFLSLFLFLFCLIFTSLGIDLDNRFPAEVIFTAAFPHLGWRGRCFGIPSRNFTEPAVAQGLSVLQCI